MAADLLADANLDLLADRLERLDPEDIAARRRDLRQAERDAEDAAEQAVEQYQRVRRRRIVVDFLLVGKSGAMFEVEQKSLAVEDSLDRLNDPRGHQRAVIEVLQGSGGLLTPADVREHLAKHSRIRLSLPAVQNLLSRMARRNPPLVSRPARGRYGPPPTVPLTPSTGGGTRERTHVRPNEASPMNSS